MCPCGQSGGENPKQNDGESGFLHDPLHIKSLPVMRASEHQVCATIGILCAFCQAYCTYVNASRLLLLAVFSSIKIKRLYLLSITPGIQYTALSWNSLRGTGPGNPRPLRFVSGVFKRIAGCKVAPPVHRVLILPFFNGILRIFVFRKYRCHTKMRSWYFKMNARALRIWA